MNHTTNRHEQQATAEARLRDLSKLADDLLLQIDGTSPAKDKSLRIEAARISGVSLAIIRALCHDDVETAYRICCAYNLADTALGMTG